MKKQTINFSWPAILSDFSMDTANENFSRGTLKVFYQGETADKRYFSKAFAEELVKTLPYTPVVGHYDETKDDFIGHATNQEIFGIVDPLRPYRFEEDDDGKVWCVCDVVLYTERPGRLGELAKKIVGHKQSLELDPSSVKYTINYDEKRRFKNIEFTAGRFIGVSVLGHDQSPAFTGSAFFSLEEPTFEKKMQLLKEYCENAQTSDQLTNGGITMTLQDYMKLSLGDLFEEVNRLVHAEYDGPHSYGLVRDLFDDYVIIEYLYRQDESALLKKVLLKRGYSCDENGAVTLDTDVKEVRISYVEVEPKVEVETEVETEMEEVVEAYIADEKTNAEQVAETELFEETINETEEVVAEEDFSEDSVVEEETVITETAEEFEETKIDEVVETEEILETAMDAATEEILQVTDCADAAPSSDAEFTQTIAEKVSAENEQDDTKEISGSSSFADSERAELETLKREKKIALISSYKDTLTDEEYDSLIESVDSFETETDLELDLLRRYKEHSAESNTSIYTSMRVAHTTGPRLNNSGRTKEQTLDGFLTRYIR